MRCKLFLLLLMMVIFSCNKKSDIKSTTSVKDSLNQHFPEEDFEEDGSDVVTIKDLKFPSTGKNIEDFVLEPCEIKMKAEGFLNDDELKDIVIVLQNENDSQDSRAVLVLLKQETGEYKLQDVSWEALDPEYTENGYQVYTSEEISIENKILHIMLQSGGGPPGTRETLYKYVNNDFVLIEMHTFSAGAGAHMVSDYNLMTGVVEHEVTNTLNDSIPAKNEIKKFELKRQMLFAKDNPNTVLEDLPGSENF
ncbi:hypothetical protein EYY60_16960 [Flavobacterium zhairuonense]|uniref:hypothetical protein n=1 Tax=Flavobacterium zhairuonense TaxID=2493631 RepID=UPI00105132A1|nr:hypothetical protein [Flavobacterium zhairuonense]KAF2507643.1 hypothetical protein EYY60_16960 [Flavobacterium zhairuonense]